MEKTLLKDLKRRVFLRSALISLTGLDEVFAIHDSFSGDEILFEIFKRALKTFEQHNPLVIETRLNSASLAKHKFRDNYFEIKNNFQLYLDCLIDEDQITLIPNSTPYLRVVGSYPTNPTYFQPVDYERPYICLPTLDYLHNSSCQGYWMRGTYNRPIISSVGKTKEISDQDAIYWMNIEEGLKGEKFVDQCLVDVLEYVRNLKGNFQLPNYPVDIFGAVDIAYQQLKMELDQFYLQSNWAGELLI